MDIIYSHDEKIAEYQRCLLHREVVMAIELDKVQREHNEDIQAITARCQNWKNQYYRKEEECKSLKRELDFGSALCRFVPERSLQRPSSGPFRGHIVNMVRVVRRIHRLQRNARSRTAYHKPSMAHKYLSVRCTVNGNNHRQTCFTFL